MPKFQSLLQRSKLPYHSPSKLIPRFLHPYLWVASMNSDGGPSPACTVVDRVLSTSSEKIAKPKPLYNISPSP